MNITAIQLCTFVPPTVPGTPSTSVVHASFATREIDPGQSYIIKAATGLDAEDIISSYIGNTIGAKTYNIKPADRIVTLLLSLNPNYNLGQSPSTLRDALYKIIAFNRRSKLQMRFMDGDIQVASLFGDISKFEASAFNSDSEIQITFTCDYSFLRHTDYIDIGTPVNLNPAPDDPPPYWAYTWNDDLSTAPHGFNMTWVSESYYSIFSIASIPDYDFTIIYDFEPDDRIVIGSEDDNKYVYVDRHHPGGGPSWYDRTYLADKIEYGSLWPIMKPGVNTIESYYIGHLESLTWRPSYWGI